jgi:hypothetical protein
MPASSCRLTRSGATPVSTPRSGRSTSGSNQTVSAVAPTDGPRSRGARASSRCSRRGPVSCARYSSLLHETRAGATSAMLHFSIGHESDRHAASAVSKHPAGATNCTGEHGGAARASPADGASVGRVRGVAAGASAGSEGAALAPAPLASFGAEAGGEHPPQARTSAITNAPPPSPSAPLARAQSRRNILLPPDRSKSTVVGGLLRAAPRKVRHEVKRRRRRSLTSRSPAP